MWQRNSKILTPLSSLSSKQVEWNWSKECQKAFDTTEMLVSRETLLSSPNFNKPFEIHTNASKLQIALVISQRVNSLRSIAGTQSCAGQLYYHKTWILSIAEILIEFRNMQLGQQVKVYRDHKNLT